MCSNTTPKKAQTLSMRKWTTVMMKWIKCRGRCSIWTPQMQTQAALSPCASCIPIHPMPPHAPHAPMQAPTILLIPDSYKMLRLMHLFNHPVPQPKPRRHAEVSSLQASVLCGCWPSKVALVCVMHAIPSPSLSHAGMPRSHRRRQVR